jgi:hypothetical protein
MPPIIEWMAIVLARIRIADSMDYPRPDISNYVVLLGRSRVVVIDDPTVLRIELRLVYGLVEGQAPVVPSVEKNFDGSEAMCCIAEHEVIVVVSLQFPPLSS